MSLSSGGFRPSPCLVIFTRMRAVGHGQCDREIRHMADVLILTSLISYPREVARGGVFASALCPIPE